MAILPLPSNSVSLVTLQPQENSLSQIRQDFNKLANSLQSGNLTAAQSAYSNLEQLLQAQQNGSTSSNSSNSTDPIQNDFSALGQALSSGNLTQAQNAFAQLKSDIQAAQQNGLQSQTRQGLAAAVRGHHHGGHHHHGGGSNTTTASTDSPSSNSSSVGTTNKGVNLYA